MPRVNITISQELKDYFENLSRETGAPQSSLMAIALKDYIDQKKAMKDLSVLVSQLEVNKDR